MMAANEKQDLRADFAARRQAIPAAERQAAEQAIRDRLFALQAWSTAPLIVGYASVRGEICLDPVWQAAIAQGKDYALPCTCTGADKGRMIFRRLPTYDPAALVPARYGIPEPTDIYPILRPSDLDGALLIVPGLAFDDKGFRVGYGGGYYDRFLASLQEANIHVTTVGAVFSACRAPVLPHEPHDIPVDIIIDERRITFTHGTA